MRNALAVLPALTFLLSMAACGAKTPAPETTEAPPATEGTQKPEESTQPPAADPVTLKVYTWWDITKFEHLQKMNGRF